MTLSEYYDLIQAELLGKKEALRKLAERLSSKVLGDYYEEIVREFLKRHLPERYAVAHGLIRSKDKISTECDIIIYDKMQNAPLFKSGDAVIVSPFSVLAAIEVKSEITSEALEDAFEMINSIKEVEQTEGSTRIRGYYLFGFYTGRNITELKKLRERELNVFVLSKKKSLKTGAVFNIQKGELRSFLEALQNQGIGTMIPHK